MCGIAGIINSTEPYEAQLSRLDTMLKRIAHRGPDAVGKFQGRNYTVGHVRLSIIDLSTSANQPMIDQHNGNVITYNGEIYNYIELRETLRSKGYTFQSNSDTEVILKAYDAWGIDCQNKFNGMWAFVIINPINNTVFASRDRFGIKPFVYSLLPNNEFCYASEEKAFAELGIVNSDNLDFIHHFITTGLHNAYVETFVNGIFNLLPGHYLYFKIGCVTEQARWWSPQITSLHISDDDAVERYKDLLHSSIALRMRSDVEVGSCMSGGLDSTTIVSLARAHTDNQFKTFSCIYPGIVSCDESEYIKIASECFDVLPHYVVPTPDNIIDSINNINHIMDGPTGGPSVISQHHVMALANNKVKVILDGQGADELLGGYHIYLYYHLVDHIKRAYRRFSITSLSQFFFDYYRIRRRVGSHAFPILSTIRKALRPVHTEGLPLQNRILPSVSLYPHETLNSILFEHFHLSLPSLLHYEDRNSMHYSIEARVPFLDHRLVEFVMSLPNKFKIRGAVTKWLGYQVGKELLPSQILNRKDKMGYTSPGFMWLKSIANDERITQMFIQDNALMSTLPLPFQQRIRTDWMKLNNNYLNQSIDINLLWRYISANLWMTKY